VKFKPGLQFILLLTGICAQLPSWSQSLTLRIIETSDLHTQVLDFDYYTDQPTEFYGLARTTSLIHAARSEVKNALLVDNGDLIQGSAIGEYWAEKGLRPDEVHSVYKAMNSLGYTVGNIGNHEFNYGIEFLLEAINDADFPYICANVLDAKTGKPLFSPYLIETIQALDDAGNSHLLKVGFIGFVPPQIMTWDKIHLTGRITVKDIKATAEELVPQMRAAGVDVIIAIPHSGLSSRPYAAMAENSVYYLSEVKGIDAILFGHSHALFPSKEFAGIPGVNLDKGTVNGVAAVMPGQWGDHLGIVDLTLQYRDQRWQVIDSQSEARAIYDRAHKQSLAASDPKIHALLAADHAAVRSFVGQSIGKASAPMVNYLVQLQDDATVQIVNDAQAAYVKHFIQGDPDLAELPVLSAAAPFKAGGRKNAPTSYLELAAGELSLRNAVDIYPFPNTLIALKLNGAEIREWLECSAGMFKRIDPNNKERQSLLNWEGFASYNFDVIDGVTYQIDVTQTARYDGACTLANKNSRRIYDLRYHGEPVTDEKIFLLATNNYRAYGGKFPGTHGEHIAFSAPDDNRSILISYIRAQTQAKGAITPQRDNNWSLKPIHSSTPLQIIVELSPGQKAEQFIAAQAQFPMKLIGEDEIGFALYQIDLQTTKK
jgi:2',3'-cyclic-nucleotide 2'-phosphodiesterase/3'-nucleotidase